MLVPLNDSLLKELVIEKQREYSYVVLEIEVMSDHVHLLLDVDPRAGIDVVVHKIKGYAAHTIRKDYPWIKSTLPSTWIRSRFIASIGSVSLDVAKQYIAGQKGK